MKKKEKKEKKEKKKDSWDSSKIDNEEGNSNEWGDKDNLKDDLDPDDPFFSKENQKRLSDLRDGKQKINTKGGDRTFYMDPNTCDKSFFIDADKDCTVRAYSDWRTNANNNGFNIEKLGQGYKICDDAAPLPNNKDGSKAPRRLAAGNYYYDKDIVRECANRCWADGKKLGF